MPHENLAGQRGWQARATIAAMVDKMRFDGIVPKAVVRSDEERRLAPGDRAPCVPSAGVLITLERRRV